MRADIWRRFGALGNYGKSASDIRSEITAKNVYADLPIDGTIRAETTKDVVNDILTYKVAALALVRKSIANRTNDQTKRKLLFKQLKSDEWLSDSFLHRKMRKHFRHGVSKTSNQFIVRSDKHSSEIEDGKLIVTIKIAKKYGSDIKLITNTNGKNVNLKSTNLRIIVKGNLTEIHYATTKDAGRPAGDQVLGLDKGYTEAFVDSNGIAHGQKFGEVLTNFSDQIFKANKQRNKLHALEKKHREHGNITKADQILLHNLGRIKLESRRNTAQAKLRTIAYQSAHNIIDQAKVIVSEDLTSPIAKKENWKKYNRRMSAWAKGVLAQALNEVSVQRNAEHVLVNSAYTSQMDSINGLLEGKRVGDKFYRVNGDVLQADHNAARNVLARLKDSEISRFTPYKEVKQILLKRSPAQLSVKGLELSEKSHEPSADKSK
jgi:hypothetical protein